MYVWKCWRDTRLFFLVFVVIAAAAMPVAAVVSVGTHLIEDFGTETFQSTFYLLLSIVALGLGAISAIQEFTEKTVHFLFTKPRSRAYFVWISWTVGCAEFLSIAAVNLLAAWLTLRHYHSHAFHSYLFGSVKPQQITEAIVAGIFEYSLTYSLTAVLRNGLKGLGAGFLIMNGLSFVAAAVRIRWSAQFPVPAERIASLPFVPSALVWMLIALAFVLAAQLVIERAEI